MQTSQAHYQTHLGPVYSWMLGDLNAAFARGAAEMDELPLPFARGVAIDLGAGIGLHALPLAERGFRVVALDSCQVLLDELQSRARSLAIATHTADLADFHSLVTGQPQLIVCMGDTLTHLHAVAAVETLLASVAAALPRGGVFATTFRDYATRTLQGEQRFILVRADEQRILTCFLEYADTQITVHDVLNERRNGQWHQTVSSYPKLRLAPEWVEGKLTNQGFSVRRDTAANGMTRIVATKH